MEIQGNNWKEKSVFQLHRIENSDDCYPLTVSAVNGWESVQISMTWQNGDISVV